MLEVCVVGAGFAGLACAVLLAEAGADVTVLEARDRVGGRVWSERLGADGPLVERGAEFVLDGYDEMASWLRRFGLRLADTGMSYHRREPRGVDGVSAEDLRAAAAAVDAHDHATVADAIAGSGLPATVAVALRARVEVSCAWSAGDLSPAVLDHLVSGSVQPSARVAGGNASLAAALAGALGARVRLGTPVLAIAWGATGATVTTRAGDASYDAVVVTVPLPLLRTLPLDPVLPSDVAAALDNLAMGQAAKLHVPLAAQPDTSAVLSVPGRWWSWTATVADGTVPPVVNCFAGSPAALSALDVDTGPTAWLSELAAIRDDLSLLPDAALLTTWHDDPWAQGAYSAATIRTQRGNDHVVARRRGGLLIAGEHTAGEFAGLMEGALRSGRRCAEQLLAGTE